MHKLYCDRCGLEIPEDDGVAIKEVLSLGEDDEPESSIHACSPGEKVEMRLVTVVLMPDGEEAEDHDFCTRCVQSLIEESAAKRVVAKKDAAEADDDEDEEYDPEDDLEDDLEDDDEDEVEDEDEEEV